MRPIAFPVLFRFGQLLVPARATDLKAWDFRQISEAKIAMREGRREKDRLYWIIDGNGCFRKATPIASQFSWLRSIKFLWNFCRTVYEIDSPRQFTVNDLKQAILGSSREPEKSVAWDLYQYLESKDDGEQFTRKMFLEFMGASDEKG